MPNVRSASGPQKIFVMLSAALIVMCGTGLAMPPDPDTRPYTLPPLGDTRNVDRYIRNNIGGKGIFTGIANLSALIFFRSTLDPRVLAGKNGWLFYREPPEMPDDSLMSTEELEAWRRYLEERTAWCAHHGIRFVAFIAPDKQTVYPEYLVSERDRLPRREQLMAYLRAHTSVRVVDLTDAVRAAKKPESEIYYTYGTHWTSVGAYAGYRFLAAHVPFDVPPSLDIRRLRVSEQPPADVRLLELLHVQLLNPRRKVMEYSIPQIPRWQFSEPVEGGIAVTSMGEAARPRTLIYGDSFLTALMPFLFASLGPTTITRTHDAAIPRKDIESLRPTIVLQEFVERKLRLPPPEADEWMRRENEDAR